MKIRSIGRSAVIKHLLLSFLITVTMMHWLHFSSVHILGVIVFALGAGLLTAYDRFLRAKSPERTILKTGAALGLFFTAATILADRDNLFAGIHSRLFLAAYSLIFLGGFACLYITSVTAILIAASHTSFCEKVQAGNLQVAQGASSGDLLERHPGLITFLLCMLIWGVWFLSEYPGVMTVDSLEQYGQIIGARPFSDHHPYIHTLLIGAWYRLGLFVTGSPVHAIAFYTVFQMTACAAITGFLMMTLTRLGLKRGLRYAVLLFFACYPVNGAYSVTMWKDILFSYVTLLFVTLLVRLVHAGEDGKERIERSDAVLFVITGVLFSLLRSNGLIAYVVTVPFLIVFLKGMRRQQILLHAIVLAVVLIIKIPVAGAVLEARAEFVESLSIPVQTVARVYADGEPVSDEMDRIWNRIMDTGRIPETYEPHCADHMKNLIRLGDAKELEDNKAAYLKAWIAFGLQHPLSYMRGYIDTTRGYWYPDVPNLTIGFDESIAPNDCGLSGAPVLKGTLWLKIRELLLKLPQQIPLYGLPESCGAITWALLLLFGIALVKRGKAAAACFVPCFAILLTLLLATPVTNEYRYAYPVLLSLPMYLVFI